jgi:hypothetical protein
MPELRIHQQFLHLGTMLLVAARICTKMAMRIDLAGDWARFGRRAMGFREARMLNAQAVTAAMLGTSGIYLWI